MRVRYKERPGRVGVSGGFNTHGLSEVVVYFEDGDATSEEIAELDVMIGEEWVDMSDAFRRRLLITDNHNTHFFEPPTEADRERGYTLS